MFNGKKVKEMPHLQAEILAKQSLERNAIYNMKRERVLERLEKVFWALKEVIEKLKLYDRLEGRCRA